MTSAGRTTAGKRLKAILDGQPFDLMNEESKKAAEAGTLRERIDAERPGVSLRVEPPSSARNQGSI